MMLYIFMVKIVTEETPMAAGSIVGQVQHVNEQAQLSKGIDCCNERVNRKMDLDESLCCGSRIVLVHKPWHICMFWIGLW